MIKNTDQSYSLVTIALHWVVALLVIALFVLGLYMTGLTYYDPWYKTAPEIHKGIGVIVFVLLLLRLGWRWLAPTPAPGPIGRVWERRAAHWVHAVLYALLVVITFSGYFIATADGRGLDVFGWFEIPSLISTIDKLEDYAGEVHFILAVVMIGLVVLHALAALKHHFIDKDVTLLRMLGMNRSVKT